MKADDPGVASEEWMVPFLLLCMEDGGSYGYELEERVRGICPREPSSREVYRALREMERDGLLVSESGLAVGGPGIPWRRYGITAAGEEYLESRARDFEGYGRYSRQFLRAYSQRGIGKDLA